MLKCVAPKCAEILSVWRKTKGLKYFKKAYLHGEHMLVICRPLATFGQESKGGVGGWDKGDEGMKKKVRKWKKGETELVIRGQKSSLFKAVTNNMHTLSNIVCYILWDCPVSGFSFNILITTVLPILSLSVCVCVLCTKCHCIPQIISLQYTVVSFCASV